MSGITTTATATGGGELGKGDTFFEVGPKQPPALDRRPALRVAEARQRGEATL
ncbi:hypothetical protein ACWEPL_59655 [Nonomuraea sp. NPDC004186]